MDDAHVKLARKIAEEYRESMDKDVLHSWAKDAVLCISQLEAELSQETERCAKIAEESLMNTDVLMSLPPKSAAAFEIARRIRG